MNRIKTIADIVNRRLCIGCGACTQVLEKGAVVLKDSPKVGLRPVFNRPIAKNENYKLLAVCPGIIVPKQLLNPMNSKGLKDNDVGDLHSVWIGYAIDKNIRYAASSGGIITALSLYSIDRGLVNSVVHTRMDEKYPWKNKSSISYSRNDIKNAAGSRYAPSSPCELASELIEKNETSFFVGKPCDAVAMRLLVKNKPELGVHIKTIISFFCAGTPTTESVYNLATSKNESDEKFDELRFRGDGWPGNFRIKKKSEEWRNLYSYSDSWGVLQKSRCLRCQLCADGMGQFADVSCGDAWHLYKNDNSPGLSVIIARNKKGYDLIKNAEKDGYIALTKGTLQDVKLSQGSDAGILNRRRQVWGRLFALSLFRIAHPTYTGFPLFRAWLSLSLKDKIRSVLGTVLRIYRKKLFLPEITIQENTYEQKK